LRPDRGCPGSSSRSSSSSCGSGFRQNDSLLQPPMQQLDTNTRCSCRRQQHQQQRRAIVEPCKGDNSNIFF
jgi:hypothetical protein